MTWPGLDAYLTPDLLEGLGDAVMIVGADWRYRYVSARAAEIIGRPAGELVGQLVWDVFPEAVGTPRHEASLRVMEQRVRERSLWHFPAVEGWYEQHAIPVNDGLLFVVHDVSDRLVADDRSQQLVGVGEALARATSVQEVHEALVSDVFPRIGAAGGSIMLADEERGVIRAVDWSSVSPDLAEEWAEFPLSLAAPSTEAHRTGRTVVVRDLEECRQRFPAVAGEMERIGRHAVVAVPLVSAGVGLGALIANFETGHAVSVLDERFLTTTAAMTAQAIVRIRLLEAERQSMSALQRSLLPIAVADIDGLALVARYAASDRAAEIGGDWYDVIPLPGGGVGLVMGDVEGHDLGAAALMGLVRSAMRAYALEGHPPAIVIARANTFLASLNRGRIATLAYAQLHPVERLITVVSAGHLGIQVAPPEGELYEVPSEIGPPLGVFDTGMLWPETTSVMPPHVVFAMFTDGLVEVRGEDIGEGIRRVCAVMEEYRTATPDEIADRLLLSRGASYDDVALVVGRLLAEPQQARSLTRRLPATPASVLLARRFTTQLLDAWGVGGETGEAAELVMSELVTNAARHSEDFVLVRLACDDRLLRIEVEDTSHRMPNESPETDQEATGGRGLLLVSAVSSRWGVESEGLSKCVWAEFDLT